MLKIILGLSFVAKIIIVFFIHEKGLSDEWLVLFDNFEKLNLYTYYTLEGQNLPSSYMPPLYLIFLYINKILSFELFNFIYLVYFSQVILSTLSVILFFKLCNYFIDSKLSIVGVTVFAFFPLLVFSNAIISSATIQLFLYLLFVNFSIEIINEKKKISIISYSIVIACCLLLRGEFLIILFLSFIFILINNKKRIKFIVTVSLTSLLIISPYLIRNYINTDKVHITSVTGYALWKGNNHFGKVEGFFYPLNPESRKSWPDIPQFSNLYKQLDNLKINKRYELERDQVFFHEALDNIFEEKKKYLAIFL